jgi:hypothetical protein
MAITVSMRGPLLDGQAPAEIARICREIEDEVAAQGSSLVHERLNQSIRNPTPYYETQIVTDRAGRGTLVHDRGIVYGPWLEGVGSRNKTTRFKGYFSFRRATHELRRQAPALAEIVVRRNIGRLQ